MFGRDAASFAIDCVARLKIHIKIHYPNIWVALHGRFKVTKLTAQVVPIVGGVWRGQQFRNSVSRTLFTKFL